MQDTQKKTFQGLSFHGISVPLLGMLYVQYSFEFFFVKLLNCKPFS